MRSEGSSGHFCGNFTFPFSYPPIDRRKSRRRRLPESPTLVSQLPEGFPVAISRHVSGSERNSNGMVVAVVGYRLLSSFHWYGAYQATYPALRSGSSGLGCYLNPPKWPGGLGQNFVCCSPQYIGISKSPLEGQKEISEPSECPPCIG
jgi:hypothetical protein